DVGWITLHRSTGWRSTGWRPTGAESWWMYKATFTLQQPPASRLFLLALRRHPQHFLQRGQPRRDLLRAGQAQAVRAVLEGLAAQGDEIGVGGDQWLDAVVEQHDLVDPGAPAITGVAAFDATHRLVRMGRQRRIRSEERRVGKEARAQC